MPTEAQSIAPDPAVAFSLFANPFAQLGATARSKPAELAELANRIGSPAAATALRTLSVPRTRLGAEVAFLPGAADATSTILAALHSGASSAEPLPPGAAANLLAHLCAAGLTDEAGQAALVAAQLAPGDATLADAIEGDRAAAGLPALQAAMLPAEQDQLADQHAAALVASCRAYPDPAARLAALVRGAGGGPPASFMRRTAAAWARQSAAELVRLEEAASAASRTALQHPAAAATARLVAAIDAWAALSLPQRLSDARAGLDHSPTLRAIRPWRDAGVRLAEAGQPDLALPLAQALAQRFADLPGEGPRLAEEARACAGQVEERTLTPLLAPLRALAAQLAEHPEPLETALEKAPLGPQAADPAGTLWRLFDAAAAACVTSEAPWTILRDLAARIGGKHKLAGASCALAIHQALAARAEAAKFDDLAARLRAQERGLQGAAALWRYILLADELKKPWAGPFRRRRTLAALRTALSLSDDPADRTTLLADERKIAQRVKGGRAGFAILAVVIGLGVAVSRLDQSYSEHASYRTAEPQAITGPITGPTASATPPSQDQPASAPTTPEIPMIEPVAPMPAPRPERPARPPTPALAIRFPTHTALAERQPREDGGILGLAEVRWCKFNEVRLTAAFEASTDAQQADIRGLGQIWRGLCDTYDVHRADEARAARETQQTRTRLETEGRAMLTDAAAR